MNKIEGVVLIYMIVPILSFRELTVSYNTNRKSGN